MTVNGTMGIEGTVQSDRADAAAGDPPAFQLAQARTTPAMSSMPRTTSEGNAVRASDRPIDFGNQFIEDIEVISL
jgi:hypothetical protein